MNHKYGMTSLALALLTVGCPALPGNAANLEAATVDETQDINGTGASTYFQVTHRDQRRCYSPMCGGTFIKRVNRSTTRCSDGTYNAECHAYALDLAALGLSQADMDKFTSTFEDGLGVVRGSLRRVRDTFGNRVDTLVASEAWVGASLNAPVGTFYGLSSNGIQCIAAPCATLDEEKLNYSTVKHIHGLNLAASGANDKQVALGMSLLDTNGLLVAGHEHGITGAAGRGVELVASEFYFPVLPAGIACGQNTCAQGEYCCNESCGMCAHMGVMCIQRVCP